MPGDLPAGREVESLHPGVNGLRGDGGGLVVGHGGGRRESRGGGGGGGVRLGTCVDS